MAMELPVAEAMPPRGALAASPRERLRAAGDPIAFPQEATQRGQP